MHIWLNVINNNAPPSFHVIKGNDWHLHLPQVSYVPIIYHWGSHSSEVMCCVSMNIHCTCMKEMLSIS